MLSSRLNSQGQERQRAPATLNKLNLGSHPILRREQAALPDPELINPDLLTLSLNTSKAAAGASYPSWPRDIQSWLNN
jgi:hypothetical protein